MSYDLQRLQDGIIPAGTGGSGRCCRPLSVLPWLRRVNSFAYATMCRPACNGRDPPTDQLSTAVLGDQGGRRDQRLAELATGS